MSSDSDLGISIPIIKQMGAEVLELTPCSVKVKMPLAPNINHVGIMYAGSLFTLAEFPVGVVFMQRMDSSKVVPVVAEVNIRYRRPALTDIYAHFEFDDGIFERLQNEALEKGKASHVHHQELKDENGEVVAITEGRYVVIPTP